MNNDVSVILPCIGVIVGTIFYQEANDWDLPTSFFFSAQTLLGIGAGVPSEDNDVSYTFSFFFIVFGNSIITGMVIFIVNDLYAYNEEAARFKARHGMSRIEHCVKNTMLEALYEKWIDNFYGAALTTLFFVWLAVGIAFGVYWEGWDLIESCYFIVSLLSGTGNVSPVIDGNSLGNSGWFLAVYVMVGFPLYQVNEQIKKNRDFAITYLVDNDLNPPQSLSSHLRSFSPTWPISSSLIW